MDVVYDDVRSPGSFGSIRNLMRYSGRSKREVKTFLSGRDAYTLHKPRKIRFPRRKTYSKGIADLYQIDLADMSNISSYNDGVRYRHHIPSGDVQVGHGSVHPVQSARNLGVYVDGGMTMRTHINHVLSSCASQTSR